MSAEYSVYVVVEYDKSGKFCAVMSGMGKNKGKWESNHSRSAAYRHARALRLKDSEHNYKVEPVR